MPWNMTPNEVLALIAFGLIVVAPEIVKIINLATSDENS
jgi:hypothetical protein